MNKTAKKLKRQKGQVLVVFLLIIVMALAIVLSIASRTITDIRTTTTSDESNRAYFAAESGIEEALKKVDSTAPSGINITTQFSNATATTTAKPYYSDTFNIYAYPEDLAKDSTAQIILSPDPHGSPVWAGHFVDIFFGKNLDQNQAIEVSVVSWDTVQQKYTIKKWGFDPVSARGNSFCPAATYNQFLNPGDFTGTRKTITHWARLYLRQFGNPIVTDSVPGCSVPHDPQLAGSEQPILLRIKALYNSNFALTLVVSSDSNFPSQGVIIESTGSVSSVTRKILAIRLTPSLPALFDYVLFTNGDLSK